MSRPPCGWCQCQCKPKLLAQWVGTPPWTDGSLSTLPEAHRHITRSRYLKAHQWRVIFDDTNAEWIHSWYVDDQNFSAPDPVNDNFGGPVRDGAMIANYSPANTAIWENFPWRLELGCVSCRSCPCAASSEPSHGQLIYWPNRTIVGTNPVTSGGTIVDTIQTTSEYIGDNGRSMTADEISRHHWWGNKHYGTPTEPRKCPPEIIVWSHSHAGNTAQHVSNADINGELKTDPAVHVCDGWTGQYEISGEMSQRFRDVNIDDVDIIRIVQPMYPTFEFPYSTWPAHIVSDVGVDDYAAINDWLNLGGKLLIIDGGAGFQDNTPDFISEFSGLTVTLSGDANSAYQSYYFGTGLASDFEIRSHDHALTDYPQTVSVPKFVSDSTNWRFWAVTGGETLYSFHWLDYTVDPLNPTDESIPGAAVETLASGSRIILAPSWILDHNFLTSPALITNWTLYGNADTIPNIRARL